jgi:hypothetical protein
MLVSAAIARARDLLQDTKATPRWPDPEMLRYVSDGQAEVASVRPDSLYISGVVVTAPPEISAVGQTLAVQDKFVPALVDYICYRCLMKDAEHAANEKLAKTYMESFSSRMNAV